MWLTYGVPRAPGLVLSALQTLETGVPYGAVAFNGVNPQLYVTNPGYLSPPGAVTYYLTPRDAFRTEGQRRTDFAANYAYKISRRGGVELFGSGAVAACQGAVERRPTAGRGAKTMVNQMTSFIPLRRLGLPAEVARTICFMLSEAASYMTGARVAVDGGFLI